MAPTATYHEIADRYEEEPAGGRRTRTGPGDAGPLGIGPLLRDLLGEGSGVCLEVGHTAPVRGTVRELGWTPLGVGPSAGVPRPARDRPPAVRADAGRLPVRDGSVPAVLAVMVHTDVPDYPAVLREAARVLRPGGVFVHVGEHPCSCGGLTDRTGPETVVVRPGRADGRAAEGPWTDRGVRDGTGAPHRPLPELLHAFLDAGLTLERFAESGAPTPAVLAVGARKYG
ncbi:MAG TPA: methyltransferase domain-containing protein [Streptomyces sp.]|uniref:class I SAM-dependent methyltransferase n=1 Tax=Streptomyces sp. TaxID=1931 RepID=UPI002D41E761|nr:methyltransferase domain-containing protein [Streptomyces sp.]HZG06235.1 methyltransferase domain-containing protein [Streptomyces sp.]